MSSQRPRYTGDCLPPYSYVPGHFPHPLSDPEGHLYGEDPSEPRPLRPAAWRECDDYLYGIDLFNHGFYWEAHEAWESLWHAAGREGVVAGFLKGLIKLAAAGVKAREGNPRGVKRHVQRMVELLEDVETSESSSNAYCGLDIDEVVQAASRMADGAEQDYSAAQPQLLLDFWLKLREA